MTPSNVILLAAVGIMLGAAAILNLSPYGSLGRYQMIKGNEMGLVIRIDTVTGDLSRCSTSRRVLECERWAAPEVFSPAPAPQANQ
jgi:hypothetical protein